MKLALHGGTIEVRDGIWEYSTEPLGCILYKAKIRCGDDMRTLDALIALGAEILSFERYKNHVPGRVY
jgi:hypothetical protein